MTMSELPLFAHVEPGPKRREPDSAGEARGDKGRRQASETSAETRRAAAASIAGCARDHRDQVLRFLQGRGALGGTDEEVSEALDLKLDTARARRCELRDAGDVIDGGGRRPTHSGRRAVCWVAVDQTGTSAGHTPAQTKAPDPPATRTSSSRAEPASETGRANGLEFSPGEKLLPARLRWRREGRCYWCGRRDWLVTADGRRVCRNCHPPAGELA